MVSGSGLTCRDVHVWMQASRPTAPRPDRPLLRQSSLPPSDGFPSATVPSPEKPLPSGSGVVTFSVV